jgi:hypothetical protein
MIYAMVFSKDDRLFRVHEDALIIIYHDALEVCYPLGSHAGTHKRGMFYYTLGNLDAKVMCYWTFSDGKIKFG